jgi:hypothetical protein
MLKSGKTSLSTTQTALQSGYGSLRGTLFIFLLKIKTGTLFGHSSSTQCLHAASSGKKRISTTTKTVGLAAAKVAALRINLNLDGCGVVAPPMHAPSRAPLHFPLLHTISLSPAFTGA